MLEPHLIDNICIFYDKMTEIHISVESRFKRMDDAIQAQNVGDQLATLFYGKRLIDCGSGGALGQKQNIRKKNVEGHAVIVHVSPSWSEDNELCKKHCAHIGNIIRHGQKNGVNVSLKKDD